MKRVNLEPKRFHVYSKAVPAVTPAPRALRESDIEKHLVKRVKALGGEVRKVQWIGRRGAPDRLVMMPHWLKGRAMPLTQEQLDEIAKWRSITIQPLAVGSTVWVELKAPGEKPRPEQLREHTRMRAMGQRVEVIDSIEGVERLLT